MKRLFLPFVLLASLTLAGCGTPLERAFHALTTSVANPVRDTDIYRVENAYAAALQLVVDYRQYCWTKSYRSILADPVMRPVCEKRRVVVRAAQHARKDAARALGEAESFIANNPTLNAATVIQAAWDAVTRFQSSIPKS